MYFFKKKNDLDNLNVIGQIIGEITGHENTLRKKRDWISYNIAEGNLRNYVNENLETIFPISFEVMRTSNFNFESRVIKKLSQNYLESPKRLINGKNNDYLNKIYKENSFDSSFQNMERIYNRSRHSLLWLQKDFENINKYRLGSLDPHLYDLVIDPDTAELVAVILSTPGYDVTQYGYMGISDGQKKTISTIQSEVQRNDYRIWTAEKYIEIQAQISNNQIKDIQYIEQAGNIERENTLGMLPFVWLSQQPQRSNYPVENGIQFDTIDMNILGSILLTAAQLQVGTLVIKYPEGANIKEINQGLKVFLKLPQSKNNDPVIATDAQYIVPNSDLAGMKDVLIEYAGLLLPDYGLEGTAVVSGKQTFNSALERMISQADASKAIMNNQKTFQWAEEKIFEILKKYSELDGINIFKSTDTLAVQYERFKVLETEKERLDLVNQKYEMGVIEDWEKIQMASPGMTEREAKKKLEKIKNSKSYQISLPEVKENKMSPTMQESKEIEEEEEDIEENDKESEEEQEEGFGG